MKTILFGLLLSVALVSSSFAQKEQKLWTEWTQKEAEKMLNDSPWAQVQKDVDTTEMFFQPTADPRTAGARAPNSNDRLQQGATNQATNLSYGVRFFTARPVRQAFMRMIQLQQPKKLEPEVLERMKNFAELPASDSIIITVTVEGTDKRSLGSVMQVIESAATGTLKNTSYLERNDGKRLFLQEYVPPGRDGFGARFIFPRVVDEGPFLNSQFTDVRFVADFGKTLKLNRRFKLADMMLDGKLEY
jgi:hypothetical protein